MNQAHQEALAAVAQRIEACKRRGDAAGEVDARAERAHLLTLSGDYAQAAAELGEAARLCKENGRFLEQGQHQYAQGLLLLRVSGASDEARAALRQAGAVGHLLQDADLEIKSLERLADLAVAEQDLAGALGQLDLAVTRLVRLGRPEILLRVLRSRIGLLLTLQRPSEAQADLEQALAVATGLGDEATALSLRLERAALLGLAQPPGEPSPLDPLVAEAQALGSPAIEADALLQQAATALRGGALDEGIASAEKVRRLALDLRDPLRYLLACLLVAEGREHKGDRPGVLAILLTCKVSLEGLLGPEAGRGIVYLLDSLALRWGEEGLAEARRIYREQMAGQRPPATSPPPSTSA